LVSLSKVAKSFISNQSEVSMGWGMISSRVLESESRRIRTDFRSTPTLKRSGPS
jgi:hypothetical protein